MEESVSILYFLAFWVCNLEKAAQKLFQMLSVSYVNRR